MSFRTTKCLVPLVVALCLVVYFRREIVRFIYISPPGRHYVKGVMHSSSGARQEAAIVKYLQYFYAWMPEGSSKERVLEIMGPPRTDMRGNFWLYPKREDGKIVNIEDDYGGYLVLFDDGKLLYIDKCVGTKADEDMDPKSVAAEKKLLRGDQGTTTSTTQLMRSL